MTSIQEAKMSAEELRKKLVAGNWHIAGANYSAIRTPTWYAWRPAKTRDCQSNEKPPSICIYPWDDEINGVEIRSMEMEICGEIDGVWYKLQAYAMPIGTSQIEPVSKVLMRAWEAL